VKNITQVPKMQHVIEKRTLGRGWWLLCSRAPSRKKCCLHGGLKQRANSKKGETAAFNFRTCVVGRFQIHVRNQAAVDVKHSQMGFASDCKYSGPVLE
jgi:hypothetical protein